MTSTGDEKLTVISGYRDDSALRGSFNALAGEVFGIDFEPWYRAGFWNERYVCCSFAAGGEVVANVSVNMMDLMVCGEVKKAVQIGTVMTRRDHRKKGLSAKLMDFALEKYCAQADLVYLFANESAYGFYPHFGFEEAEESSFYAEVGSVARPSPRGLSGVMRRMDIDDPRDFEILSGLARRRVPVSKKLGTFNDSHLIMFYCVNFYRADIYYIEKAGAVIIYKVEGDTLYFYDAIAEELLDPEMITALIAGAAGLAGARKILFMFTPEFFMPSSESVREQRDYKLFVKPGVLGGIGPFAFPRLSHA